MQAWTREQFEQKLKDKGQLYHIHHPFHIAMHQGECSKEEIRGWGCKSLLLPTEYTN